MRAKKEIEQENLQLDDFLSKNKKHFSAKQK
jgi:hypothetical protein